MRRRRLIDYVLNVAVGISAGVGALVSAVPALHAHILSLCLGILVLITLVNLRGTLESGRLFAIPTYLLVASFFTILGLGIARTLASAGSPTQLAGPGTPEDADKLRAQWHLDVELPARRAGLNPPRLVILQARYRAMHVPLIRLIREIQSTVQGRRIAVLIRRSCGSTGTSSSCTPCARRSCVRSSFATAARVSS
ncbi:MAG: APC family permease [Steroidobacteraceae bacterium]|nr:APC family permease [Steroidobacteraceae bacterium]